MQNKNLILMQITSLFYTLVIILDIIKIFVNALIQVSPMQKSGFSIPFHIYLTGKFHFNHIWLTSLE